MPSWSRKKNIGGTGSPMRETSSDRRRCHERRVVVVLARQADAGLDPGRVLVAARQHQRDPRVRSLRRDLDPAVAVAEGDVRALLQAQLADVELDRLVLVGDGDHRPRR